MIYIIDEILIDTKKYKNLSIQPLTETKNIYFYFLRRKIVLFWDSHICLPYG